jgi:hypothetical protein
VSIASTQLSMGYVGFTQSPENCEACRKSEVVTERAPYADRRNTSIRCTEGSFWVARSATCRKFERADAVPAAASLIQIGPLDV